MREVLLVGRLERRSVDLNLADLLEFLGNLLELACDRSLLHLKPLLLLLVGERRMATVLGEAEVTC